MARLLLHPQGRRRVSRLPAGATMQSMHELLHRMPYIAASVERRCTRPSGIVASDCACLKRSDLPMHWLDNSTLILRHVGGIVSSLA